MQADGSVQIRKGIANGQLDLSGQEITAQKLLVKQLSAQIAIAQNVAYLNDLTVTMNEKDYVIANGTAKLQKPFAYTGAATAHIADLSTFEPLLNSGGSGEPGQRPQPQGEPARTEEKKTPLAGSLVVNWNGQGEISTFKNNGDLKLKLEKARFADLQNLEAAVEAHYTPQKLQVPIVYLASDKLSLQTSVQSKDGRLEISNLQIDQGKARWATAYASVPFYWSHLGSEKPLFPPSGSVQINFQFRESRHREALRDIRGQAASFRAIVDATRRPWPARTIAGQSRSAAAKPARGRVQAIGAGHDQYRVAAPE